MNHAVCTFFTMLAAMLLTAGGEVVSADTPGPTADDSAGDVGWPFFAFDNGVGREKEWTPSQQAELAARLGYDGIGYTRVENLDARFAACDANRQSIFSFYEAFTLGEKNPISPEALRNLPRLKGRNAILWIHISGKSTEDEAIASLRLLSDEAAKHGVRIAIYPHVNNYVETSEHALQLANAVGRENLGMSINVCHELKAGNGKKLVELVKNSIDRLFLVSINGADRVEEPQRETGWSRLIQPLGEGDFDLVPFLTQLHASGYRGPIGLQCYQVQGETDEVLEKSIRAWRKLIAEVSHASVESINATREPGDEPELASDCIP